jgi:hypothetical protein
MSGILPDAGIILVNKTVSIMLYGIYNPVEITGAEQ